MRIASLSPAATEIVGALGLGDHLVGVTRRCDWPPEVVGTPVVTRVASPSIEIDEEALVGVRPDLVVILAASGTDPADHRRLVERARALVPDATIVALDPTSIEGILNAISTVGAMTSAEDAALDLVESLRARLGGLEEQVQARRDGGQPPARIVALGSLAPVAVGRWIPEQVRRAGGWELLGRDGEPASVTSWEAVRDVDPEMLVLMPAGLSLAASRRAWDAAPKPSFWRSIEAVRRGQVFAVDGEAYFARPGPRVIEGIAILAEIFDPDGLVDVSPVGSWTPLA